MMVVKMNVFGTQIRELEIPLQEWWQLASSPYSMHKQFSLGKWRVTMKMVDLC
jgi:hypothetical protein